MNARNTVLRRTKYRRIVGLLVLLTVAMSPISQAQPDNELANADLEIGEKNTRFLPAILQLLLDDDVSDETAIPQEPELAWANSYSANGQCYCTPNLDENIADARVETPYGDMTVRQICADIGPGPGAEGQPLYNDVQCGNGPANDEPNETFCPARVDRGIDGCTETGPVWTYPEPSIVIANPALNNGPLQNPLKGFHIGFDATCCVENPQENYFGSFMATVGYQNFSWAELEPEDDEWNWGEVERQLSERPGSKNKHVIVQLNAEWTRGDRTGRAPAWFLEDDRFEENVDEARGYRSHKYESEFYQTEVKEFIAEFIHRFKDDPRIFIIQMGMVGYFGEFNVFPNDEEWLPENIKTMFFEHYRDHIFGEVERVPDPDNPDSDGKLVVVRSGVAGIDAPSYDGLSALTQARYPAELGYNVPTAGIGYTNGWINVDAIPEDGNNDVDIGNKDFNDPLDDILSEDGRNLWSFGPVGGEWPPNREPGIEGVIEEWTSFWSSDVGEDYIKRGHYSFARPPQIDTIKRLIDDAAGGVNSWSLVPDNWNVFAADRQQVGDAHEGQGGGGDLFRQWHRMMGYNYQISNVQHFLVADNSRISLSFDVNNIGLAAFHFDWDVEVAILNSNNEVMQLISIADADMREWSPDAISAVSVRADLTFDVTQPDQEYRIGLRMVQPGATEPKDDAWKLNDNLLYVVISNDVEVIEGVSNNQNQLEGGWNILDTVVSD